MFEKFIKAFNEYTTQEKRIPAPYIRKGFTLKFKPEKATLRICTPGFYELYINGTNITKGFLAPYIANPDQLVCYDEYDITSRLVNGKNAIGIILGNGFANQSVDHWSFSEAQFRAPLCVSVELFASDERESFELKSDESFKVCKSPIIYDMYRYGTHYDARKDIVGWANADHDDSKWENAKFAEAPKGEIIKCTAEPVTLQSTIRPISITYQKDFCYLKTAFRGGEDIEFTRVKGGYLYDFGVSRSGVCKLKIKGERGQKITIRHGERLTDDGVFNINSIYTFKEDYADYIADFQTDVYILSGNDEEIYIPQFTYHGFRYAFVEGITEEQATDVLLTFLVFNSDVKARSGFSCSNEALDTLYKMAIAADLSNFHYFPTDCPHREKNGWTGDISASAEQMLLSFDCKSSFELWLNSLRHSQLDSGMLPGIVPTSGWGYKWGNGPAWDSVCVNLPYYIYKYDGDPHVLVENGEVIFKYLKYISSKRDDRGLLRLGLGDWVQPFAKGSKFRSPIILTDSCMIFDIARKSEFIFDKLKNYDAKAFANRLANELKDAIRRNLIDFSTATAAGGCQTSQALLLYLGIFNDDERAMAYRRLLEIIEEDGRHTVCGMIGLRVIFDVLCDMGNIDLALEMILQKDSPSYAFMIKNGATALCEALEENGVQESQNHHFFGDIIRIFVSRIAGLNINPSLSDCNSLVFSPCIPSSLDRAYAEYRFECGKAYGGWKKDNGKTVFYITVPNGVSGSFAYKEITHPLKEGYNEFTI